MLVGYQDNEFLAIDGVECGDSRVNYDISSDFIVPELVNF